MLELVNIIASIITIANFIVAILSTSVPAYGEFFTKLAGLSPSAAFFMFFILEILCSIFICSVLVGIYEKTAQIFLTSALFFGIINVATTVFNYKVLFHETDLSNSQSAAIFSMFIFGALLVDMVVIRSISLMHSSNRDYFKSIEKNRFLTDERRLFIFIQGMEYFVSALYFISITKKL